MAYNGGSAASSFEGRMRTYTRRQRRFSFAPVALFRGRKRHASGQALDLSPGGMAVFTSANFELDEPLEVRFPLPQSAKKLRVRAFVRSQSGQRWGLEFSDLKPLQTTALHAACRVLTMR